MYIVYIFSGRNHPYQHIIVPTVLGPGTDYKAERQRRAGYFLGKSFRNFVCFIDETGTFCFYSTVVQS